MCVQAVERPEGTPSLTCATMEARPGTRNPPDDNSLELPGLSAAIEATAAMALTSPTPDLKVLAPAPPPAATPRRTIGSSEALARFVVRMRTPEFPSPTMRVEKSETQATLLEERVLTLLDWDLEMGDKPHRNHI